MGRHFNGPSHHIALYPRNMQAHVHGPSHHSRHRQRSSVHPPPPSLSPSFRSLNSQAKGATNNINRCGSNLLTRFEAAGLKDCKQTHLLTADKPALFSVVNKTQCDAYRELLRGAILKGGIEDVKTAEDVEAFMEELLHDVEQGTNFHWILSCVVGRKGNVE